MRNGYVILFNNGKLLDLISCYAREEENIVGFVMKELSLWNISAINCFCRVFHTN